MSIARVTRRNTLSFDPSRDVVMGVNMYKRILLAYDGSVEGRTALREGALLAKQCGAEVFLLSVLTDTGTLLLSEVTLAAQPFRWKRISARYSMKALRD